MSALTRTANPDPTSPGSKEESLYSCIRGAVAEALSDRDGCEITAYEITDVCHRYFSKVAFITVATDRGIRRLVAKTIVHHRDNKSISERENQSVVEFRTLEHLYPRFQEITGCSVCRPIAILPEYDTVILEFVEGHMLDRDLTAARHFAGRGRFKTAAENFRLVGKWLRHFHEFSGFLHADATCLESIVANCAFRLGLLIENGDPRIPAGLEKRVMAGIRKQQELLDGQEFLLTGVHADFGPWNILANSSGVTALDFFGCGKDLLPTNIVSLLLSLEREKWCMTASTKRISRLQNMFLTGYGQLPPLQEEVLRLCETYCRICTALDSLNTVHDKSHRKIEKHFWLKTNLKWLVDSERQELLLSTRRA